MKEILLKRIDEYMINFFNGMFVIRDEWTSQKVKDKDSSYKTICQKQDPKPKVPVIWADEEETKDWAFRRSDRYMNSFEAINFMTKARLPVVGVIRKDDTIGSVSIPKDFRYFEPSKVNVFNDGVPPKVVYEVNVLSGLYEDHCQMSEQVFSKLSERPNWRVTRQENTDNYKVTKIMIEADLKGL